MGTPVTAPDQPERSLPAAKFLPKAVSVRTARRLVVDFLVGLPDERREAAELLVSELTTNAVLHARTPFSVSADLAGQSVRVTVVDGSRELPIVKRPDAADTTGRGMHLVAELADDWGTEATPEGKVVWFELSVVETQ